MKSSTTLQEIYEQPEAIGELIQSERSNIEKITRELAGKFSYIVIAARGTSDNAARYAQYLFGAHNGLQVALATPSLFSVYKHPPRLDGALIIGISQSGQSPDIVSVLSEAHRQGRPTIAITNIDTSPLANAADYVIPLHAGPEKGVAATKTYTTSLIALALFSCLMEGNNERISELMKAPASIQQTFALLESVIPHVERYCYMEHCAVLGRGYNYSTAFEAALKVKELNRIVAEPYSTADFMHGPIATVHKGFPVFVISPRGAVADDMQELIANLKKIEAELIILSDDQTVLTKANFPLPYASGLPEWLTPLTAVIPAQLFALQLSIEKGFDPDHPVGLKKVTETI
jgi:glutamine---fructose-6-phosphate transaminase (isomerizing)